MKIDHPQHPLGGPPGQADKTKVPPGQAKKDFETVLENIDQETELEIEQEPEYEPEIEQDRDAEKRARGRRNTAQEEVIELLPYDDPVKRKIKRELQQNEQTEQDTIQETVEETSTDETTQEYSGEKKKLMDPSKILNKDGAIPGSETGGTQRTQGIKKSGETYTDGVETPDSPGLEVQGEKKPESAQNAPGQTVRSTTPGSTEKGLDSLLPGPEKGQSIKEAIAGLKQQNLPPGEMGKLVKPTIDPLLSGQGKTADATTPEITSAKIAPGLNKALESVKAAEPGVRPEFLAGNIGVPIASFVEPVAAPQNMQPAGLTAAAIADLDQLVNRVALGVNASGQPEFNLQLQMREFGEIQVRVIRAEQGISILFNAQTDKAGTQFAQNLPNLQNALEQKGLLIQGIQLMVQNQAVPINQIVQQVSATQDQRGVKKDSKDSAKEKERGTGPEPARGGKR